ncbi:MAG: porin [Gammaproteobacteria bacterium]|nr:porin [Gammaproteobacteria bacterium]
MTRLKLQSFAAGVALTILCAAGPVQAQDADVAALEARVAELESMLRKLVDDKAAPAPAVKPAPAPAAKPAPSASGPTTSYKFGGYAKFDAMFSDYSDATPASSAVIRQFYLPSQTPVGDGSASSDATVDFQGRETRLNFRADTTTAGGNKVTAFAEMDFFTHSDGNELVSNSYSPRLRHAFVKYNKWTFGQTWSTFQDVSVLPENLDFVGPAESTTFVRQAMVRYTSGNLELAAENPETFALGAASTATGHDTIPDLIARYTFKLDGGSYIRLAGLVRFLNIDEPGGVTADENGFGLSASAKFMVGEKDDIRAMLTYGDGVGRYVGLGLVRDGAIDALGTGIDTIETTSGFVSWRHHWQDKWRSNFTFGTNSIDLPASAGNQTESASSFHANLIYNPLPKLDIGAEIMYAERELQDGTDGDFTRFLFSAKYAF